MCTCVCPSSALPGPCLKGCSLQWEPPRPPRPCWQLHSHPSPPFHSVENDRAAEQRWPADKPVISPALCASSSPHLFGAWKIDTTLGWNLFLGKLHLLVANKTVCMCVKLGAAEVFSYLVGAGDVRPALTPRETDGRHIGSFSAPEIDNLYFTLNPKQIGKCHLLLVYHCNWLRYPLLQAGMSCANAC